MNDFFDGFKKFFDVNDKRWAPKSTRIWRLQQYEWQGGQEAETGSEPTAEDVVNQLEAKLNSLPPSARPSLPGNESASSSGTPGPSTRSADATTPPLRSFEDAEDSELSWALNRRIAEIATAVAAPEGMEEEEEEEEEVQPAVVEPLTAQELRQLLFNKYGKTYDMSFVRRDIPGKTFVCLNVMWTHLEQRSFQLTEEQYMEKLDGIAYLLNALEQTAKVRAFLLAPRRSQKGLPPRPVVGTAISIQLDLDRSTIDEWFGRGYQ